MSIFPQILLLEKNIKQTNFNFWNFFGPGGIDFDFWFEIYNDSFPFLGFAEALDGCHFKQSSLQICKI